MFGFTERELLAVQTLLSQSEKLEKAVVFGSRALGNYKPGSDVDVALIGERLSRSDLLRLFNALNETCDLPYQFDLVDYNKINNPRLKDHIDQFGIPIWRNEREHEGL